ncbi:MAG: hypothetical protein KKB50_14300, partial [Planctomycetes bacterium]|nr:hypothetical protein [Planctomycetota bacterium]
MVNDRVSAQRKTPLEECVRNDITSAVQRPLPNFRNCPAGTPNLALCRIAMARHGELVTRVRNKRVGLDRVVATSEMPAVENKSRQHFVPFDLG